MEKRLLPIGQWKVLLCAITLFLTYLAVVPLTHWERYFEPEAAGSFAVEWGPPDAQFRKRILAIYPASPLAAAGAHVGDQVQFLRWSDNTRWPKGMDEQIPVRLFSGTQSRDVLIQPVKTRRTAWSLRTVSTIGFLWIYVTLGIGFLIGWRRADNTAMRILALSLMAVVVQFAENLLPAGPLVDWCSRLSPVALVPLHVGAIYFMLQLPESAPHWRHAWVRRAFYLYAFATAADVVALVSYRFGVLPVWLQGLQDNDFVLPALTPAIVMAISWFAWRRGTSAEKTRVAWIGICFSMKYLGSEYINIIQTFSLPLDVEVLQPYVFVWIMLSYIGLAYAILRHKLFDVGFAVNRVLVYSIMSTLLLTLFSLTEFGVDKLLHFEGREKNVIFDAAVALGIILTFHRIQHWVNHRVDHVFFHHWQAAADKLRAFVDRSPHILEPDALQTKFMRAVEEFGHARGTAIYWADADGTFRLAHATLEGAPAALDGDDDVAVELRHTRAVVDRSGHRGTVPADLVFPLVSHSQVAGMLLVGAKASGHSWRPDEIGLLAKSVPRICVVLEALRLQKLERTVAEEQRQRLVLERELAIATSKATIAELKLAAAGVT